MKDAPERQIGEPGRQGMQRFGHQETGEQITEQKNLLHLRFPSADPEKDNQKEHDHGPEQRGFHTGQIEIDEQSSPGQDQRGTVTEGIAEQGKYKQGDQSRMKTGKSNNMGCAGLAEQGVKGGLIRIFKPQDQGRQKDLRKAAH